MPELSRVEDLLATGVEEPVIPMSRLEAILRGEKIKPQSRVEELLLQYNPSDILIEKHVTENGTYYATTDNADGYFKVVVDTPVTPAPILDHLIETISSNGEYTYTPTHTGYSDAKITVAVPEPPSPVMEHLVESITRNGVYTYTPTLGGYSDAEITVDVGGNLWLDNEDKTLTIKITPQGLIRFYFNGFVLPTGVNQVHTVLADNPELWCYFCWPKNRLILTKSYVSDVDDTQNGWIGMYQNSIRGWNVDKHVNVGGTFWGVLDLNGNNYEESEQTNPYVAPDYKGVDKDIYRTDAQDVSIKWSAADDTSVEGEINNE
jgi:hypothetical protein